MTANPIQVLIVDDHSVMRAGLRLILERAPDIQVTGEAPDSTAALALLRERPVQIMLLDIGLPGKNGLEFLKVIKADWPKVAVLILSAYSEEVYAVRALKAGASGYLGKDSDPAVLLEAVRKVAAGGRYINPSLIDQLAAEVGGGTGNAHEALSNRELEVLRLLADGYSLLQIAERLHLSPKTITTYRARIVEKTGLQSNAELARYALSKGLVE